MKTVLAQIRPAILATAAMVVVTGIVYPVVVWGAAQGLFRSKADGSLVSDASGARGSALLAQNFSSAKYFHPRPSAAGTGYDATSSGGTNFGPTSSKLAGSIKDAVAAYRTENGLSADALVPADAVTSSASGLDPDISLTNAHLQAARVAKARGLDLSAVLRRVDKRASGRDWGLFGEPRVNVLELNLALDGAAPEGAAK
jgi:K+-transporting ATPase ATPase C chain